MFYQIHYEKRKQLNVSISYIKCQLDFFLLKGVLLSHNTSDHSFLSLHSSQFPTVSPLPQIRSSSVFSSEKSRHPKDTSQTRQNKIQEKARALIFRLHKATQQKKKNFKGKQKSETHPASLSGS